MIFDVISKSNHEKTGSRTCNVKSLHSPHPLFLQMDITVCLRCSHNCRVILNLNSQMNQITNYPGMRNHENDAEAVESEKFRQKVQSVKRDPTAVLKTLYNE